MVAALIELPVENASAPFMSGVYDTALRWALGQGSVPATRAPTAPRPPGGSADMPYPLPATHGFTGAEEPIDADGRVPSGKGRGVVTWSQHAALGQPYRDFYITMRWNYAAWNWDGTSTGIDQAQFAWFAEKPRLVLVTNPRTGASIIAAALEAGPAPWVGRHLQRRNGFRRRPRLARSRSAAPPTGTPGSSAASRPPRWPPWATPSGPARTGYLGQAGDDLTYQWAPDQNATPGPVTGIRAAAATARQDGCAADSAPAPVGAQVRSAGVAVTIPTGPTVDPAAAGQTITAPTEAVARGLAAGLGTVGLPYVWGGGTDGGGPDNGCARGGGQKNSCGHHRRSGLLRAHRVDPDQRRVPHPHQLGLATRRRHRHPAAGRPARRHHRLPGPCRRLPGPDRRRGLPPRSTRRRPAGQGQAGELVRRRPVLHRFWAA